MSPLSTAVEGIEEAKPSSTSPRRSRIYLACAVLLGLVLVFTSVAGFRTLRALSFLYDMSPQPLRFAFIKATCSKMFHHDPVVTEFSIQGRNGPLQIRMFTPRDLPHAPVVVLVHGFAARGFRDVGMNEFAKGLSRTGLRVVLPNIVSEEKLQVSPTGISDVDDVIRWSALESGQKVSVFGISFSGGMVIAAAAQPGYADYVKLVLCVSGYNSIDRLGRFYLHEDVRKPDSSRYTVTPYPTGLASLALQYLDELVPPEDIAPLSNALREIAFDHRAIDTLPLTKEQRALLEDVIGVKTPEMRQRYDALLERHRAELAAVSPMGKINQVSGSLYVLHGTMDPAIPAAEAQWTQAEIAHRDRAHVLITAWLHHDYMNGPVSLRDRWRVISFVRRMLDEAFHPVPLAPGTR